MQAVFMQALRQTPGGAAYPTTLQIFSPDALSGLHEYSGSAAILQGRPENTVLPCATNRQQVLEGCFGRHTNRKTGTIKDSANKLDPPDQLVGLIAFYLLILHLLAIQYGVER